MPSTKTAAPVAPVYGMLAEFSQPDDLVAASKKAYAAGFRQLDAFSPIPVHGLAQAIGFKKDRVAMVVLISALCGASIGLGLQAWAMAYSYPLNIGGRPLLSLPSFFPVMFECTILFAGFSALIGMLMLNGLPRLNHPVFEVPQFSNASVDKFFLLIKSSDPKFNVAETKQFLDTLGPESVAEVPNV